MLEFRLHFLITSSLWKRFDAAHCIDVTIRFVFWNNRLWAFRARSKTLNIQNRFFVIDFNVVGKDLLLRLSIDVLGTHKFQFDSLQPLKFCFQIFRASSLNSTSDSQPFPHFFITQILWDCTWLSIWFFYWTWGRTFGTVTAYCTNNKFCVRKKVQNVKNYRFVFKVRKLLVKRCVVFAGQDLSLPDPINQLYRSM